MVEGYTAQFSWVQYSAFTWCFSRMILHTSQSAIRTMLRLFPMISITLGQIQNMHYSRTNCIAVQRSHPRTRPFYVLSLRTFVYGFRPHGLKTMLYFQILFLYSRQQKGRIKGEGQKHFLLENLCLGKGHPPQGCPSTSHWPEMYHIATSTCKGGWEAEYFSWTHYYLVLYHCHLWVY